MGWWSMFCCWLVFLDGVGWKSLEVLFIYVSFFGGGCYMYVYIGIGLTIYSLFGDVLSNPPTSFCLGVSVFYFGDSD